MWAALASIAMGGRLQTSTRSSAELYFHGLTVSNTSCAQRWPELCRLLLKTHFTSKKTWKYWLQMFIYFTNFLLKYCTVLLNGPKNKTLFYLRTLFFATMFEAMVIFLNNLLHSFPTVTVTIKYQFFFSKSVHKKWFNFLTTMFVYQFVIGWATNILLLRNVLTFINIYLP